MVFIGVLGESKDASPFDSVTHVTNFTPQRHPAIPPRMLRRVRQVVNLALDPETLSLIRDVREFVELRAIP
jgi:hypothetical protein